MYQVGQFEEAIDAFEKSSALSPSLGPLNLLMTSMALAKQGKLPDARARYADAIQKHAEVQVERELFEVYRQQAEELLNYRSEESPPAVAN